MTESILDISNSFIEKRPRYVSYLEISQFRIFGNTQVKPTWAWPYCKLYLAFPWANRYSNIFPVETWNYNQHACCVFKRKSHSVNHIRNTLEGMTQKNLESRLQIWKNTMSNHEICGLAGNCHSRSGRLRTNRRRGFYHRERGSRCAIHPVVEKGYIISKPMQSYRNLNKRA